MTPADVEALVRDDMRALSDPRVIEHVYSLLVVPPRRIQLGWIFGAVGEPLDGFHVLDHPRSGTGILYCRQGFGPESPWGMVFTGRGPLFSGTSDGWYPRFLDVYFESKASTDVPIWRVREWRDGAWVPDELPWGEAWERVSLLRASASHVQYYCDHSIIY